MSSIDVIETTHKRIKATGHGHSLFINHEPDGDLSVWFGKTIDNGQRVMIECFTLTQVELSALTMLLLAITETKGEDCVSPQPEQNAIPRDIAAGYAESETESD